MNRNDGATRPEMVILTGLQASGKSTFYRERFGATHVHISKDNFRNNPRPARRQERLVREALEKGCRVVVDNTNPTRVEREALIALGREYGARVIGYGFERNIRASVARNAERNGKAKVSDVAIFSTAKAQERPSLAEGYDELYYVSIGESGFVVEAWREETGREGETSDSGAV